MSLVVSRIEDGCLSELSVNTLVELPIVKRKLNLLDEKMLYHNFKGLPSRHILRVIEATTTLCEQIGIDLNETKLLRISAFFHDIDFSNGAFFHEIRSARFASQILLDVGLGSDNIDIIENNIKATQGSFVLGAFITVPTSLTEKILCDADLAIVAESPIMFWSINNLLRQELKINDCRLWVEGQKTFLKKLKWHTKEASALWNDGRMINIDFSNDEILNLFDRLDDTTL